MRLTAVAEADIEAIWTYTNARWGPVQADSYTAAIRGAVAQAGATPQMGQRVGAGWRYRLAGRHRIFYRIEAREIVVARVLHVRMDERLHLP